MKIYPYLSDRRQNNNTGVKYVETCNLQKVWESSDSLNGNSCFTMINLYSICNSNDQRRIFKMTECNHRGKGERNEVKKEQICPISYFWIRSLSLRRNHLHTNLQVKARLYVNFNALRKYDFLDTFFSFFLCCDDSKYHSLNWKEVSDTNVDIFEKKHFSLQFFFSLHQVYIVYRVSFIFRLNAFLVSFCTKGFTYSALLTAGKRNKTPGVHAEIFVSWILQLFAI